MASVLGNKHGWRAARSVLASLLVLVLSLSLVGCGDRTPVRSTRPSKNDSAPLVGRVSEVSPPAVIQELGQDLEAYQPQLKILSPKANEVLKDQTVSVRFQLKDLPLYKDQNLGLGPHLHVILDNQPYKAVYSLDDPLVFEDLEPGTHTIRAFASRPWHESFKNEGAYAQVTFHVLTKTPDNNPLSNQPLLTYSRPVGTYGAEPVMLDFYLTNTPLHLIAQERSDDEIKDWRIRCTVNGESFIFDEWQPIYLKGLKPGKNWVQLELLDEDGKAIPNAFNNTVRIIHYEPGGEDTLSRLVRGELLASGARGIVDPTYKPEPEPEPEPLPIPEVPPTPAPEATPAPVVPTPEPEASPSPVPVIPGVPAPEVTPAPAPTLELPASEETEALPEAEEPIQPSPTPAATPKAVRQREAAKPGSWRDRFRKRSPEPPAAVEAPATPVVPEAPVEPTLEEPEQAVSPPEVITSPEPTPEVTPVPSPAVEDWRDRIRRRYSEQAQPPAVTPSPVVPSPAVTEPAPVQGSPAEEPEPESGKTEETDLEQPVQPEPVESPKVESPRVEPLPPKATRTAPAPQKPAFDAKQFFERFRQSASESAESVQQSVKSLIDRYSAPPAPVAPEVAPIPTEPVEPTQPTEPIEVPSVLPSDGEPAVPVSPE